MTIAASPSPLEAVLVLAYDLISAITGTGAVSFASLGDLWGKLSVPSLNLMQAIVQRYLHPALWDLVFVTILLLPAWLVFAVPSLLLYVLGRKSHEMTT